MYVYSSFTVEQKPPKQIKTNWKPFHFILIGHSGRWATRTFVCHFTHYFSLHFLQFPDEESRWHTFITTASFLDRVEKPTCAAEIALTKLNLWLKFFTLPFYSNSFYDVKWVWYTGWRSRGELLNHQVTLFLRNCTRSHVKFVKTKINCEFFMFISRCKVFQLRSLRWGLQVLLDCSQF